MAVTQQQLLFAELRDTFARRLTNHLNNVFVHQVTRMCSRGLVSAFSVDLRRHIFSTLSPAAKLLFSSFFLSRPLHASFSSSTLLPGFLVSFPSGCLPTLPALSSLCSLSSSQFNHFSHFKMTLPQFYRSSRLSLPVSTAVTATHSPGRPFANVSAPRSHPNSPHCIRGFFTCLHQTCSV